MKVVFVTINFIRMDYVVLQKIIVSSNLIDFQNTMEKRSKLNVYKNLCNVLEYGKWLTYVQVKFCINVEVNILNYQALWRLSMASWQIGVRAKFLCNTQKVQILQVSHFHDDSYFLSETLKLLKFFRVTLRIGKRRLTMVTQIKTTCSILY